VALFPTAAPVGTTAPSWWTPACRTVHYVSAIVLFLSFIVFAIWLFRKSNIPRRKDRPKEKQRRDTVCLICGIAMILGLLWAAISIITQDGRIFWPETIAILSFAISWLAKGEADVSVRRKIGRLASIAEIRSG